MNIFAISPEPNECSRALDDVRLRKMVLETAQLLSTAIRINNPQCKIINEIYKPTHINHPCAKWARESVDNILWLTNLGLEYSAEYFFRFKKDHKSCFVIQKCAWYVIYFPKTPQTPFPNCTDFKDEPNVFEAYKKHLNKKWARDKAFGRAPTWTRRDPPDFYVP